jgi:hypothetical protein
MPLTLTEAQEQLDAYLLASKAVAEGKQYAIAGRVWYSEDAKEIREMIIFWQGIVKELADDADGGRRIRGVTPIING